MPPLVAPDTTHPLEQRGLPGRAETDFKLGIDLFALPVAIPTGTNTETGPVYVRGYNTFQVWCATSGPGQVSFAYGICHPREPYPVVAYRTVVGPIATGVSMLVTFGAFGQSAVSFQGDLFTILTLRFAASAGLVNLNAMVLWCGLR